MLTAILEPQLLNHLNLLSSMPLPLASYMYLSVDPARLPQWLLFTLKLPNSFHLQKMQHLLDRESCPLRLRNITSALAYLFLTARKESLSQKQMTTLLKQNTMMSQQFTQLILSLYSQFITEKNNKKIEGCDSAQLQWSAIAIRQTQEKEHPNRLYMKVQLQNTQNANSNNKTFNMTLVQYRLLAQDFNKAQSLLA